jgi:hypothetical protein
MCRPRTIITVCSACGREFPSLPCGDSPEFDNHDCPATPPMKDGESWEDYSARADEYAENWRRQQIGVDDE